MKYTMDIARNVPLPRDTVEALASVSLPDPVPPLEQFLRNPGELAQYAEQENGLLILRLFLEWIPALQEKYQALGIPETVFRDNLKDLTIWAEHYRNMYNIPCFGEWEWVAGTFFLRVFRLGRLQFEPSVLEQDVPGFPAGTPVLEVHIPAGEPLDPNAVAEAMEQAPAFFQKYFQKQFTLFRCHSWLLCPGLQELLPDQSRILRFQNLFTVYGQDSERQAEERVFGFLADNPALYPEKTSLQRSLKQALLDGKTMGIGIGIRKIT